MARRYEVTDTQWEIIKSYLGNTPKKTGRPQSDNRKILNGILWILHTGAPWRDLPNIMAHGKLCISAFFSGKRMIN